jgi:hypothetical protein
MGTHRVLTQGTPRGCAHGARAGYLCGHDGRDGLEPRRFHRLARLDKVDCTVPREYPCVPMRTLENSVHTGCVPIEYACEYPCEYFGREANAGTDAECDRPEWESA